MLCYAMLCNKLTYYNLSPSLSLGAAARPAILSIYLSIYVSLCISIYLYISLYISISLPLSLSGLLGPARVRVGHAPGAQGVQEDGHDGGHA